MRPPGLSSARQRSRNMLNLGGTRAEFITIQQLVIGLRAVVARVQAKRGGNGEIARDVLAERRICENDVEPALLDAVHVEQPFMLMHAYMTVAVHDHIHLGRARGAGFLVCAIDAAG